MTGPQAHASYPGALAREIPNRAAIIVPSRKLARTYGELDDQSRRVAGLLRAAGLKRGDHIAYSVPNGPEALEIAWGAQRSGLYYTPISTLLTEGETDYIIANCDARALFAAPMTATARVVQRVRDLALLVSVGGPTDGWEDYESALARSNPIFDADESEGQRMVYTSGTTGRPKGVHVELEDGPMGSQVAQVLSSVERYGLGRDSVFLSPGPLYHAAPITFSMVCHRLGATLVVMDRFDPVAFLRIIEQFSVTHAFCVPTMFVRLLALDRSIRQQFDLSSLQTVLHAAAPCPPQIKREMIDWLGPVLVEFYGGSEGYGGVWITSQEWLARPGSVGCDRQALAHIVDDGGNELPAGQVGQIFFGNPTLRFSYYNDPAKTAAAQSPKGWYSFGDIGYLDESRYLYLTDRRDFTIISGGVNIYPQEIEDLLISHPDIEDAAVFGLPDPEFGERVVAAVCVAGRATPGDELRAAIDQYCRANLAGFKIPRVIVFEPDLPRAENGKLYKRRLRERYVRDGPPSDV